MKRSIFLLSILLLLFQCSNDDSNSETPYSDISVDYVYPENNDDSIPINHQFLLYFNQSINPDELRKKVILSTVTDGEKQQVWYNVERYQDPITHETINAYKTCVIKPSNLLEQNKQYTITINKGLLSTEHGQLKETQNYTFTTAFGTHPELYYVDGEDRRSFELINKEFNKDTIKLCYNEQLNPYYINNKSILLEIKEDEAIEIELIYYNPDDASIIIYPHRLLESGILYRIRLARSTIGLSDMFDLAGVGYKGGEDVSFSF